MSRDDGFAIADIDVGILDDPKIRKLMRRTQDEAILCRALVGYTSTILASWGDGERLTLEDAAPIWLTDIPDLHERLVAVELLDPDGRIPLDAWERWFLPAWERREKRRQSGAIGGRSHGKGTPKHPESDAQATLNPSGPSGPDRSSPSVDTPLPPASGGSNGSPRANGTNPRQLAADRASVDEEERRGRVYRRQQRQIAVYAGNISDDERRAMDATDSPLNAIPGWADRLAAVAAERDL